MSSDPSSMLPLFCMDSIYVFNSKFMGKKEEEDHFKLLSFLPQTRSHNDKMLMVGLAEATANFLTNFRPSNSNNNNNNSNNKNQDSSLLIEKVADDGLHCMISDLFIRTFYEPEPGYHMVLCVKCKNTLNHEYQTPMYMLLKKLLISVYDTFALFHGPMEEIVQQNEGKPDVLRHTLDLFLLRYTSSEAWPLKFPMMNHSTSTTTTSGSAQVITEQQTMLPQYVPLSLFYALDGIRFLPVQSTFFLHLQSLMNCAMHSFNFPIVENDLMTMDGAASLIADKKSGNDGENGDGDNSKDNNDNDELVGAVSGGIRSGQSDEGDEDDEDEEEQKLSPSTHVQQQMNQLRQLQISSYHHENEHAKREKVIQAALIFYESFLTFTGNGLSHTHAKTIAKYLPTVINERIKLLNANSSSSSQSSSSHSHHQGLFITGPTNLDFSKTYTGNASGVTLNSNEQPRFSAPRLYLKLHDKIAKFHLIVYRFGKFHIALLVRPRALGDIEFYFSLKALLDREFKRLSIAFANASADVSSGPSILSKVGTFDETYKYVYFNHSNLAVKSSGVYNNPKLMHEWNVVADMHRMFITSENHNNLSECIVKVKKDSWVVGKYFGQREFYLVFDQKNYSLVEINDQVHKITNIFFSTSSSSTSSNSGHSGVSSVPGSLSSSVLYGLEPNSPSGINTNSSFD